MSSKLLWPLALILFSTLATANEQALSNSLASGLTVDWAYDCDSIVENVTSASERRLNSNGYSIVQITNRKTLLQSETEVDCKGDALTNRGSNVGVEYGAYLDSEGDWIFYWKL